MLDKRFSKRCVNLFWCDSTGNILNCLPQFIFPYKLTSILIRCLSCGELVDHHKFSIWFKNLATSSYEIHRNPFGADLLNTLLSVVPMLEVFLHKSCMSICDYLYTVTLQKSTIIPPIMRDW